MRHDDDDDIKEKIRNLRNLAAVSGKRNLEERFEMFDWREKPGNLKLQGTNGK